MQKELKKKSKTPDNSSKILDGLKHIISRGASKGASDIHIEPRDQYIWVRYRVGSNLQLGTKLPLDNLEDLVATAKELAGLSLAEKQRPQDGDFELSIDNQDHHVHLFVTPVLGGEKMVIHLSPSSLKSISLDDMGFWGANLDLIKKVLGQIHGFVVVGSADRNSGLMSLYGILNLVSHPSLKLASVGESTVEHTQITSHTRIDSSKGLTPDRSLRLIIRQNPDVILISDLSDKTAAKTALEYASKKLVCCNVMAEDVAALIQRLSNMGLDPLPLANTMRLSISQTIIRKLCEYCREAYTPTAEVRKQLDLISDGFIMNKLHGLEQQAQRAGLGKKIPELSTSPSEVHRLWRAKENGCEHCHYSGFAHYTTLNEVLDTSSAKIQNCLTKQAVTRAEIQEATLDAGMLPKRIDGVIKCLRGMVSIDDVLEIVKVSG